MKANTRLDGAIDELQFAVKRWDKQEIFMVSNHKIVIKCNPPEFWGTVFYIALPILLPAGLAIYHFITGNPGLSKFLLLLTSILFAFHLYKLVLGNTILTIDFDREIFQVKNNNGVLKNFSPVKTIPFREVARVELREKSSRRISSWLRLSISADKRKKIVLTDIDNRFPENLISEKIKSLIQTIITVEKKIESL